MNSIYDVVIVGAGPAGLAAAIYMARANFSVLVLEKEKTGGQITITSDVVNYPGIIQTDGKELTENMRIQAENFGAEIVSAEVKKMDLQNEIKHFETSKGVFESVGAILATGASPRKIGFKGEEEFQGRGIAYCATCDGEFFTGLDVFVIGGGFAAAEEAVFLTKYAKKVTIMVREEDFTCAKSVADHARENEKIEVHYQTEILEAGGDGQLEYAIFRDNKTGKTFEYRNKEETFGVFVFAGYVPATQLMKGQVDLTPAGNIITDKNQKTNIDGVYGAGDVCDKNLRQVVTAVADGAVSATSLEKYIPAVVKKLDLADRMVKIKKTTRRNNDTTNTKETSNASSSEDGTFITGAIKDKLEPVLSSLKEPLVIKCEFNDSDFSKEMEAFIEEFSALSDKIKYEVISTSSDVPSYAFYDEKDNYLQVKLHLVPGGHEFNSFIIAVYNAVGAKQKLDDSVLDEIKSVSSKHKMKVAVSLSCTMCPDLVMATQRISLENPNIETEVFDIAHFPELRDKYKIMSVPCMIIDDDIVHFGRKDISEVVSILNDI